MTGTLCLLRAASRLPPHLEWPQGSGTFAFISERRLPGTIPAPGGSGEQEEDGFLLVFVVILISECFSPRVGEAAERGEHCTPRSLCGCD